MPLTFVAHIDNHHNLKQYEYTSENGQEGSINIWMRCPLCGMVAHCSSLIHQIRDIGTPQFTMSPSLLCVMKDNPTNPCGAHYYIEDNKITHWQSNSHLPPNGYWSNAHL